MDRATSTPFVLGIPEAFPQSWILEYDDDRSIDRLMLSERRKLPADAMVVFRSAAKPGDLQKWDVLPDSALVPVVNQRVADLLLAAAPGDFQLLPASIIGVCDSPVAGYYVVNVLRAVRGIDWSSSVAARFADGSNPEGGLRHLLPPLLREQAFLSLMETNLRMRTDTATLAIFDVAQLRHRLSDSADWWTEPDEAVLEMQQARALFVDLGSDGVYRVLIRSADGVRTAKAVRVRLLCSSGSVFVGPGEVTVSGGLEPDEAAGGVFLPLAPGLYEVSIAEAGSSLVEVAFGVVEGNPENRCSDYVRLFRK